MRHEITEQGAVGLVASRALRGTHEVKLPTKRGRNQKIVVNVRDDGQPVTPAQRVESRKNIGIELKAAEGVEVATDQARISSNAEMCKRLAQRQFADLFIRAIRLPVMCDISFFPVLPKLLDMDI